MLPDGISSHDCVITAVTRRGDDIVRAVEGAQVARMGAPSGFDLVAGTITFSGVRHIVINDIPADTITMRGDDAEILRLDWRDGAAQMFVRWSRYAERQERSWFYQIACGDSPERLTWTPAKPA
ncbi:MAG: hypothetical protein JO000_07595 [Alphaproteobacteria bacterium]|nr:hypothetical protein [Alphaproteobacteria bacterium]